MSLFLLKRALWLIFTLWVVVTLAFFLTRSLKGGPFDDSRRLPPEIEQNIREKYHWNRPLTEQYFSYLGDLVFRFDLGPSMKLRDYSVNQVIRETFPKSALLGVLALIFALGAGIGAGILAALHHRKLADALVMTLAAVGLAIPNFVLAGVLIILFCFIWTLFPAAGWGSIRHLILPALALGAPFAANIARLTRSGLLDMLGEDFILTAEAKGLSKSAVVLRHALKPALLPVVSFLGPAAAGILTGSLVIERIFAIPGMGDLFVDAALNRDHTLTMGIIIVYTALVYTLNLVADFAYTLIDPRIKLS
ncbi:MAG: ABC transporter permease subunit [Planctomycetes bacterium]|nr:ABC transporter permease subunit [Planctomycetota bacterium]